MMREADFRQLVEAAQGRAAYVPAYMMGKDELEEYVKSGMLKSSNSLAKNVKCPCGGAHVSDVFARETPDGLRYFAACDAYARMENYPVNVESLRLYKINPRMLVSFAASKTTSRPAVAKPRAERKSTVEKRERLIAVLKNQAFEMLSLNDSERKYLMDGLTGHSLHEQTKIRESTIGEMIDLKATLTSGKKELDNLLQLLYLVCKNEAVFFFFADQVKESTLVWRNKPNEELYHLLKSVLDKTLKQHLRPK